MKPLVATVVLVVALGSGLAACKREKAKESERPADADAVQPVYPISIAPNPLAAKLCQALHELPATRAAECCGEKPGLMLTGECTRMLSGAISFEAATLAPEAVDRCVADLRKAHEGCGWVGGAAQVPASCRGIVDGTLARGKGCRSTLECDAGLRCQGVGPADAGVCFPPLPPGAPCERSVDALVSFTRQAHVFRAVPECEGACERNRCLPGVALGAACKRAEECGPGNRCGGGVCVAGTVADEGQPCLAAFDCAAGLRCAGGICSAPKAEGAVCRADDECRGACVKKEPASPKGKAGSGVCGKRC